MITKNDLLLLLTELKDQGIPINEQMKKLVISKDIPLDIVKFINDHRGFDAANFYTHIRKNYNRGKSKLYINIMRGIEDVHDVLTTLSALNLQILLFSKDVDNKQMFFQHTRAQEINECLTLYYKNYDLTNCIRLMKLIKADIATFEYLSGRRASTEY